jgi:hypothetical protein
LFFQFEKAICRAHVFGFGDQVSTGVLTPGQTFSFAFNTPGEYFYNDCVWPEATGKIVVH